MNSPAQLDLVHGVVYDQCRRGRGYPSVLQEAHEQAVINAGERRAIETGDYRTLLKNNAVLQLIQDPTLAARLGSAARDAQ